MTSWRGTSNRHFNENTSGPLHCFSVARWARNESTLKGLDATWTFHSLLQVTAWFGKKFAATNYVSEVQLDLYIHGSRNQSALLCLETSPALRIKTLLGEGSWQ